jgi:murein DD-endopeptidase MepM/ murein hydrolase activator NlpD
MQSRLQKLLIHIARTLLAVIAALLLSSAVNAVEKRVALVIGNGAYPGSPLGNPVNDAKDMADSLRRLGFSVIERVNANQKEMQRAIAKFGESLNKESVALFYYAGHGMQVRGKNYLIPIDAQITSENSVRLESVDVDGLLDQLNFSDLNLVILDACRNNPFERKFRALGGAGLAQMDAPKGTMIAYATAPGKTASDGEGRNGQFTAELLRQMQIPGLTIEQVFKNVRREVTKVTRDNQTPWESSSLTGDFYFILPGRPIASLSASPAPQQQERPVPSTVETKQPPVVTYNASKPLVEVRPAGSTEVQIATVDDVAWAWPTPNTMIRSFGEQDSKGISFSGEAGTTVQAAADGKVSYVGTGLRGYGELVLIKHSPSYLTAYAHQQKIHVKEGQTVTRGQKIGEMGNTDTDSVKLHFEIRKQGKPVDPLLYLPARFSTTASSSAAVQSKITSSTSLAPTDEERRRFILAN